MKLNIKFKLNLLCKVWKLLVKGNVPTTRSPYFQRRILMHLRFHKICLQFAFSCNNVNYLWISHEDMKIAVHNSSKRISSHFWIPRLGKCIMCQQLQGLLYLEILGLFGCMMIWKEFCILSKIVLKSILNQGTL